MLEFVIIALCVVSGFAGSTWITAIILATSLAVASILDSGILTRSKHSDTRTKRIRLMAMHAGGAYAIAVSAFASSNIAKAALF